MVLRDVNIRNQYLRDNLFEKINFNQTFAKKETLEQSLFYTPIQKTAGYIYPSIQKGYDEFKNKK